MLREGTLAKGMGNAIRYFELYLHLFVLLFFFPPDSQNFLILLLYLLSKHRHRWCLKLLPA